MSQGRQAKTEATTIYQRQLHPWCIAQQLENMQNQVVARFRRRNDADDHLRILRQLIPSTRHAIVFDAALDRTKVDANR